MSGNLDIIGYLSWNGDPVRLLGPIVEGEPERVELYVAGRGFVPASPCEVLPQAALVSKAQFEQMIAEEDRLRGFA